jgi:hypothetical protein
MPDILFLTNEQRLLEIIDQLKDMVDARVVIVNDLTQGLKEIFFRQPALVFIQKEIGGITGEKVASQVRALLDEQPIRLVLLQNEKDESQDVDSNFNGSIDISLPLPELMRQLQQQVFNALYAEKDIPADAGENIEDDVEAVELSIDSQKPFDAYKIDSLADIFPADLPDYWGTPLPDEKNDALSTAETAETAVESIKPGEEFTFDTIPDSPIDDSTNSINAPLLTEAGPQQAPNWDNSFPGQVQGGNDEWQERDVWRGDQEPQPQLSAGTPGETFPDADFLKPPVAGSAIAIESGLQPEPAFTFDEPSETLAANGSSATTSAGYFEKSPTIPEKVSPSPSAAQKEAPSSFATPARTEPDHFGTVFSDSVFADDIPFRKDFGKKSSFTLKVFIGALILIILLAALFIARDWLWVPKQDTVTIAPPPTPRPAPERYLPAFVPGVAPDSAYATAHPGWERREADGLEYLIYHENGRVKAIKIKAGPQGVISVPFLKICIRETTGREDADNWVRETRDDFMVEKGTFRNKGELDVYRKLPEGDIRGIVFSYY